MHWLSRISEQSPLTSNKGKSQAESNSHNNVNMHSSEGGLDFSGCKVISESSEQNCQLLRIHDVDSLICQFPWRKK